MFDSVQSNRAALMGVVFALAGFSYALATSATSDLTPRSPGAAGRAIVGTLRFTNPLFPGSTDRDLGDAVAGSGSIASRFVTAAGGVPPYQFSSSNLQNVMSSLELLTSGLLEGSIVVNAVSPIRFDVSVACTNAVPSLAKTETFRLTLVDNRTFAFGIDALPAGSVGRTYSARLVTVNGVQPLKLYTVSNVGGTTGAKTLTDVGLAINQLEGTIYGKPTVAGTVTFTANATDKNGTFALSRNRASTGQAFTITINDDHSVSSDVVFTSIKFSGNTAVGGRDKMTVSAIVNLGGFPVSGFATGTLAFKLDSYASPEADFDAKGDAASSSPAQDYLTSSKAIKASTKQPAGAKMKAKLSSNGQLKIQITDDSFGKLSQITGLAVTGTAPHGVQLLMRGRINAADTLLFTNKTSGTRFSETYALGTSKSGTINDQGGNFMLTSVAGKDNKGSTADSFKVGFIATPVKGNPFSKASAGTASVGMLTSSLGALAGKNGGIATTTKLSPTTPDQITQLSIASTGKGNLQTGILTSTKTGIPSAKSTQQSGFSVNVTLANSTGGTVFGGDDSIQIFAKRIPVRPKHPVGQTQWSDKNFSK